MTMRGVGQKFVNAMTKPGFDVVQGEKRKGLSKALGWAKTLAANILTLGSVYVIARRIEFKAKPQLQSTTVDNASEFDTAAEAIAKLPHGASDVIGFYKGGLTEVFGNFAPCTLQYEGRTYHSVEAGFQATKWQKVLEENTKLDSTVKQEINNAIENMANATSAEDALQFSRALEKKYPKLFPENWQKGQRDQVMWDLLKIKFSQNPYKACLLATGNAFLLEHRRLRGVDVFWSDGHNGKRGNRLGDMLMALRESINNPSDKAPKSRLSEPSFKKQRRSAARQLNLEINNCTLRYAPYNEERSFVKFIFSKPVDVTKVEWFECKLSEARQLIQEFDQKIQKQQEIINKNSLKMNKAFIAATKKIATLKREKEIEFARKKEVLLNSVNNLGILGSGYAANDISNANPTEALRLLEEQLNLFKEKSQ